MWYNAVMDFTDILKPGLEAQKTETVTEKNIASAWGSGGLSVYATPAMIALMESAAFQAVGPFLPPGWSTVGTELRVKHICATAKGRKVFARAELVLVDDRALSFKVEAFDEMGKIGEGVHDRRIVEKDKFLAKVMSRSLVKPETQQKEDQA